MATLRQFFFFFKYVLVLSFASVKRFSVSRMRDFFGVAPLLLSAICINMFLHVFSLRFSLGLYLACFFCHEGFCPGGDLPSWAMFALLTLALVPGFCGLVLPGYCGSLGYVDFPDMFVFGFLWFTAYSTHGQHFL